jgi:hypothetical protein
MYGSGFDNMFDVYNDLIEVDICCGVLTIHVGDEISVAEKIFARYQRQMIIRAL